MSKIVTPEHFRIFRHTLYFAAPIFYFSLVNLVSMLTSVDATAGEEGYVEDSQTVILILAVVLLFSFAWRFPAQRAFLVFAALLGTLATIREQNNTSWYHMLYHVKGSSWLYGLIIVGTWFFIQRKVIFKQIWQVAAWPSFLLLIGGGLIVIGWAQVLAQRALYVNILDDTVTEECLESAGYLFILFGVIELYFDLRRANGLRGKSAVQDEGIQFSAEISRPQAHPQRQPVGVSSGYTPLVEEPVSKK